MLTVTTHYTLCSNSQSLFFSDGVPEKNFSYITPPQLLKKVLDAYLDVKDITDLGTKILSQKKLIS